MVEIFIRYFKLEYKKIFFISSAIVFFLVQFDLVLRPIILRELPVELDDSLVYILKSVQLNECFFQDCIGLISINEQFEFLRNSGDYSDVNFRQERMFFHVYHPIFSALLSGIRLTGLTWEVSFNAFRLLANASVLFSIIFWCFVFFGRLTGGFLLLLASILIFPEQGIHLMAPSNLSVGLGFFLLAYIARFQKSADWMIFLCSLIFIGFHQIFSIVLLMAWSFFFALYFKNCSFRNYFLCIFSLLCAVIYNLIQAHVTEPSFFISYPDYLESNVEFFGGVLSNLSSALSVSSSWFSVIFGDFVPLFFILSIFGILKYSKYKKIQVTFILVYFMVCCVSLLYVHPPAPGLLFQRLFMYFGMFSLGLFFQILVPILENFISFKKRWRSVVMVFVAISSGSVIVFGATRHNAEVQSRISRHNLSLDQLQVEFLVASADPSDRVLYTRNRFYTGLDEVAPLYYLSNGASMFHSHLEFLQPLAADLNKYDYVVTWNPLIPFFSNPHPAILINEGFLDLHLFEPNSSTNIVLDLNSLICDFEIDRVVDLVSGDDFKYLVADDKLSLELNSINGHVSSNIRVYGDFCLSGISVGLFQATNWPWGRSLDIKFESNVDGSDLENHQFKFSDALLPISSFSAVHDGGYTLLLHDY